MGFVAVELFDMENQLVEIERIVVRLAQFELPCPDGLEVIEHMFEFIEIDQRPFEFIEVYLLHFGGAGDMADQPGQSPATMGTRLIDEPAVDQVAGAIAQNDRPRASSGVKTISPGRPSPTGHRSWDQ